MPRLLGSRRALWPLHHDQDWEESGSRPNGGQISVSASPKSFVYSSGDPMDAMPSRDSIPCRCFGYTPLILISSRFWSIVIRISPVNPSKTPERSSKIRVKSWRRLAFKFFLFFVFGFIGGFSTLGTLHTSAILPLRQLDPSFDFINSTDRFDTGWSSDRRNENSVENLTIDKKRESIGEEFQKISSLEKLLIVVTPTYNRAFQAYYLKRLGHTLRLVSPPFLWIVVEMGAASMETANVLRRTDCYLRRTGMMYRHLVCTKSMTDIKDRGIHQRNAAIEHIRRHRLDGIVYFADDDNIYSLNLFRRLRDIRRFGVWPVGMLAHNKAKPIMEGPVCSGNEVVGWHTNEKSKMLRRFHVDMSGFAFNSTILWAPTRWHHLEPEPIRQLDTVKEGFQETTFIAQLVEDESQMEGLPDSCSRIISWHLHLENPGLAYPKGWLLDHNLDVVVPIK